MSAQKHTPEPWRAAKWNCHGETSVLAGPESDPVCVAETIGHGRHSDECIPDARRIVACVNYCAEVPSERLTEDNLAIKLEHIERMTSQRDALLAALREIAEMNSSCGCDALYCSCKSDSVRAIGFDEVQEIAQVAIAKSGDFDPPNAANSSQKAI